MSMGALLLTIASVHVALALGAGPLLSLLPLVSFVPASAVAERWRKNPQPTLRLQFQRRLVDVRRRLDSRDQRVFASAVVVVALTALVRLFVPSRTVTNTGLVLAGAIAACGTLTYFYDLLRKHAETPLARWMTGIGGAGMTGLAWLLAMEFARFEIGAATRVDPDNFKDALHILAGILVPFSVAALALVGCGFVLLVATLLLAVGAALGSTPLPAIVFAVRNSRFVRSVLRLPERKPRKFQATAVFLRLMGVASLMSFAASFLDSPPVRHLRRISVGVLLHKEFSRDVSCDRHAGDRIARLAGDKVMVAQQDRSGLWTFTVSECGAEKE